MEQQERNKIFRQIMWDYNIPVADIETVLSWNKEMAGHYNRKKLFQKMLESYSWFTIIQLFTPSEIANLLTDDVIDGLRTPSLKRKYEFVKKDYRKLYLLQDKFLSWWSNPGLPFYLTGGTALGRYYLNHRCSEDLDFFVNTDPQFPEYIKRIKREVEKHFMLNLQQILFAADFLLGRDNSVCPKANPITEASPLTLSF